MLKMGQNFHIGLQSGIRAATPYGEPDRKKTLKREGYKNVFFLGLVPILWLAP